MGGSALKTAKRRYEEENLTWGDNPKVVIVLLGESRNRSQCSSRSEMMSLAEHNILFALSRPPCHPQGSLGLPGDCPLWVEVPEGSEEAV